MYDLWMLKELTKVVVFLIGDKNVSCIAHFILIYIEKT